MSKYFVAGGIYKDLKGEERFDLVCQGPGEPPCVLIESVMAYFGFIWQNAHLYRVENDYTLTLVAPSHEALRGGVGAPEKVWPDANLLNKLQAVIKQATPSHATEEIGQDGYLKLTEPMSA
jgi:hypothetical protein